MLAKIILAGLVAAILSACAAKKLDDDEPIAIENSSCLNYPEPADFLPKAEQGDFEAMRTAQYYYEYCGRQNINPKKAMYWSKKLADTEGIYYKDSVETGGYHYLKVIADYAYYQADPTNVDRDKSLVFDPLLYWTWQKKMCSNKYAKTQIYNFREECEPLRRPHWYTPAQWQKIITSPPTVKDRDWYQFLPKGCENGECLPK